MKFIFCFECQDIVTMDTDERSCKCGACKGNYINKKHVVYTGPAKLLGVNNHKFIEMLNINETSWEGCSLFIID